LSLKIATWNINSVRLRIDLVARFIETFEPDIVCLQETKCPDGSFPEAAFRKLGYGHIAKRGQPGYHGVAIVSRVPLEDVSSRDFCAKGDARHVATRIPGGAILHNFYVPAGGDEPDPEINDKFAHKLAFLNEMTDWFAGTAAHQGAEAILVGDLNVAPLEHDVWSHKKLLKVVSHTPVEVEHLDRVQASAGWVDVMREFVPPDEKLYTWWSYRARDWRAADKGRRLDHVWASPAVAPAVSRCEVVIDARGWERPSDHAPVIFDLDR